MDMNSASHRMIADLLRARTGQQLTENRLWRVSSALAGVFRKHGISNLDQLVCLLAAPNASELTTEVVEALINNETYFFRDRQMFDALAEKTLPRLMRERESRRSLRIWSAGCSSGQELVSIAMMIRDLPMDTSGWTFSLIGTDISGRIIAQAREGRYSQFEIQRGLGVNQMLGNFVEESEGQWRAVPQLRSMMRFEKRSLLDEVPSGGPFDLVLCRNVLLYFDDWTRQILFDKLHGALAEDGLLMLGAGETVVGQSTLFQPLNDGSGLFEIAPAPSAFAPRKRA